MQITKTSSEDGNILTIQGTLDIGVAGELRQAFSEGLSGTADLILDLSEVDGCDAAVFQLFCSARKTAELLNRKLHVSGLSGAAGRNAVELGFSADANRVPAPTKEPAGAI